MTTTWIEMHLDLPAPAIDLVGNELAELGCEGMTVEERRLDTFIPPDPNEEPAPGIHTIKAYFPLSESLESLVARVRERLGWLDRLIPGLATAPLATFPVGQEDWAENWKQHFPAVRIGRQLVIRPSWEEIEAQPGDAIVTLDPGMAFGTGTHGTTRLCLEAIAALYAEPGGPLRVLDVGTGSGILAMAAAALGAQRVLACDIDEQSCCTARENVEFNRQQDRVEVTGAPLPQLEGNFDLVVANILAEENVRLAEELVSRVAPGGWLILSGILQEREDFVIQGFAPFPLQGPQLSRREDWSCLTYRKLT